MRLRVLRWAVRHYPYTGLGWSRRHAIGRRIVRAHDRELARRLRDRSARFWDDGSW